MRPLGFREAAEFWGVAANHELAFRLHALTGGTPEYKDLCGGVGPASLEDFDDWVRLRLVDPAGPMFREGGLLASEGAPSTDQASYASVLGAISAGAARPAEIAAALGRPDAAVADLLAALAGMGLIERLQDPLNVERSVCVIVKPIVRLHQLVIAPNEPELAAGQAGRVWARSQPTVAARIYRPHFASVARQWCLRHADKGTLGGVARGARLSGIGCREHRQEHELEAVLVEEPVASGRVMAIGETNETDGPMDAGQLRRLEHLRGLLPGDRVGQPPKLLLFSRSGFASTVVEDAADKPDVELIGLGRIYRGS
jgi:uncharacterized protein